MRPVPLTLLLCSLPACLAGPNPAPWTPPAQSMSQAATFKRAAAAAKAASVAATPQLLSALALPVVKAALHSCGASGLAALSPQQLLDRIDAEVQVTETVHGWGSLGYENELGPDSGFMYNLWEVPLLAPAAGAMQPVDSEGHGCYPLSDILRVNATVCTEYGWDLSKPGTFPQVPVCKWQTSSGMCINTVPAGLEAVETGLYGFPKFKVRGAPQNFQEASIRLIYAAFNLQRLDTGSSGVFGGIGMVFQPSYIRNMTQLAPTDTGLYAGCLLQAEPDLAEPSFFAICSEEENVTACNYRVNCDWVVAPSGGAANASQAFCVDTYCPHWKTKADCSKYSEIGCSWHLLKQSCEQITATGSSALQDTIATTELLGEPLPEVRGSGGPSRLLAADVDAHGAPFPTPPTLGCGGWGSPPVVPGETEPNTQCLSC